MSGFGKSAIVNIGQTLGALASIWLVQRGYASADEVQAALGALGTLGFLIFNHVTHNDAANAMPPGTDAGTAKSDAGE